MEKDFKIESLIFRIFLKHVKLNKMYYIFRCSVSCNDLVSLDMFHTIASRSDTRYYELMNRLKQIGSPYTLSRKLGDILLSIKNTYGEKIENNTEGQMILMNIVNGLIHCCLEYGITNGNYQILGEIGEKVFKEVCESLFGKDFVDKTNDGLSDEQKKILEKMGVMFNPSDMLEGDMPRMMPRPPRIRRPRRYEANNADNDNFIRWIENHVVENRIGNYTMPPNPTDFFDDGWDEEF